MTFKCPGSQKFSQPQPEYIKCTSCGECENHCVYEAINVDKAARTWKHRRDYCQGCGLCVSICPTDALSLQDDKKRMVWSGKGYAQTYYKM